MDRIGPLSGIEDDAESDRRRHDDGAPKEHDRVSRSALNDPAHGRRSAVATTLRKMDHFATRLAAIRGQLVARHGPVDWSRHDAPTATPADITVQTNNLGPRSGTIVGCEDRSVISALEPIQLPKLHLSRAFPGQLERGVGFQSTDALQHRADLREKFVTDGERLTRAEVKAVEAVAEAERLTEEARIAMVLFAQNERSWSFDERARRYQEVMQAKKVAEAARMTADDERAIVRCLRGQLNDPYSSLRHWPSPPARVHHLQRLPESVEQASDDERLVWILAAPLLSLPFTSREPTPETLLEGEKQLSTHVVYYAVPSPTLSDGPQTENENPPAEGWVCCSSHGVPPAPTLRQVKSTLETWEISGAGAKHINGRYILNGVHNSTKRFKSSSGVELFRKKLSRSSTVLQRLGDSPQPSWNSNRDDHVSNRFGPPENSSDFVHSMELDTQTFKSMERIGLTMGNNEIYEKRRRSRDAQLSSHQPSTHDGDHVRCQEMSSFRTGSDIGYSRPEASAAICREWVLLSSCSRRLNGTESRNRAISRHGLGCLKRHYYISNDEKEALTAWALEQEAWLEKDVLVVVIQREFHLKQLRSLCDKCMHRFQENLNTKTNRTVMKILKELVRIRFLTVKVLEAIEVWRDFVRKRGSIRVDPDEAISSFADEDRNSAVLGWSASITVSTGRKLYNGSKAFSSKYKRFCRPEDPNGKPETRIVYLGYFSTRDEAERCYDEYAASEARRQNTTIAHLPRRRGVFRSCGKHFAVESEKVGPDYCIECRTKQISSTSDDWTPPFFFTRGENYILKLASDLNFLDQITPLKAKLNESIASMSDTSNSNACQPFPLLGNVFLLPMTPMQDPSLAWFTRHGVVRAASWLDQFGVENQFDVDSFTDAVTLDQDRLLRSQMIFIREMQIYQPELFKFSSCGNQERELLGQSLSADRLVATRVVRALYWDRCAALEIQQERQPMAYREEGVWCRRDVGEWSTLQVRGKHQRHFQFENRLENSGKEMQERRKRVLKSLRRMLKTPLYKIPSRGILKTVINDGEEVKGDVVMLEVKTAYKMLERYDCWCVKASLVQRWIRAIFGHRKAQARRNALTAASKLRTQYLSEVNSAARRFVQSEVLPIALRRSVQTIEQPIHRRAVKMDGEYVILTVHVLKRRGREITKRSRADLCHSCARWYKVKGQYDCHSQRFKIVSGVCTCSWTGTMASHGETWIVRAYNPTNATIYRIKIDNPLIWQLIELSSFGVNTSAYPVSYREELIQKTDEMISLHMHAHSQAEEAFSRYDNLRSLSEEATHDRKQATRQLEAVVAHVQTLQQNYTTSVENAKKALAFTSKPFGEAQAWDDLENANDWKHIVDKRNLQRQVTSAEKQLDDSRFNLFQAHANERVLKVYANKARELHTHYWIPLVKSGLSTVAALSIELEKQTFGVRKIMDNVCLRQLTLRDANSLPARRYLCVQPSAWSLDGQMISIPSFQRARNMIRRRILYLSDFNHRGGRLLRRRMLVSICMCSSRTSDNKKIWVSAYDPATSTEECVFLDKELVRLLLCERGGGKWVLSEDRACWIAVADKLLSTAMLDRFTGEFTLRKLQFFHHMLLLRPRLLTSRWFVDLKRGRKCGDGDEILRQAVMVDGRLCCVAVHENWGDLTYTVYLPRSAKAFRLLLSLHEVFDLLIRRPLVLQLWICSVKANMYNSSLLLMFLKNACFVEASSELVWRHGDANPRKRLYKRVLQTQGRKLLVTLQEDTNNDFAITAYDIEHNRNYRHHLEWEAVVKLLRLGTIGTKNLTLSRNRPELYEWITDRLRLQRLLEHPDIVLSSSSPLVSSMQLRRSLEQFNTWILTSPRNPLQIIRKETIENLIMATESNTYGKLYEEQLAFVAEESIPFGTNRRWQATSEYLSQDGSSTPSLRMDFFGKIHNLYARVRLEMESERQAKMERTSRKAMESEELLALWRELDDQVEISSSECDFAEAIILDLLTRLRELELHRATVHAELMLRLQPMDQTDQKHGQSHHNLEPGVNAATSSVCIASIVAGVRENAGSSFATLKSMNLRTTSLKQMQDMLQQLINHIKMQIRPALASFVGNSLKRPQTIRESISIRNCLRVFCATFDPVCLKQAIDSDASTSVSDSVYQTTMRLERLDETRSEALGVDPVPAIGLLIRPHISTCTQEITVNPKWSMIDTFADVSRERLEEFLHFFNSSTSVKTSEFLTIPKFRVKRVLGGIVIFQQSGHISRQEGNPRGSIIAGEPVTGTVIFIPSDSFVLANFHEVEKTYKSVVAMSLASIESKLNHRAERQPAGHRAKHLLPWKHSSLVRLQYIRKVKTERQMDGVFIGRDVDDRDAGTLGSIILERHLLDWQFGKLPWTDLVVVLPSLITFLRPPADICLSRRGLLEIRDPCVLYNLFSDDDSRVAIPSSNTISLRFEHLRVEINNIDRPRRLTFSCRELQSRQRYAVDCSIDQIQTLLPEIVIKEAWPWPRVSALKWRELAKSVARFLVLNVRNGGLCLDFDVSSQSMAEEITPAQLVCEPTIVPYKTRSHPMARNAQAQCIFRRFDKHQPSVRAAAARRGVVGMKNGLAGILSKEWTQMAFNDLESRANRGILVLDRKVLMKLRQANTAARRRLNSTTVPENGSALPTVALCMDIAKDMGHAGLTDDDIIRILDSLSRTAWWWQKHRKGSARAASIAEFDSVDIAEWWRLQSLSLHQQKSSSLSIPTSIS